MNEEEFEKISKNYFYEKVRKKCDIISEIIEKSFEDKNSIEIKAISMEWCQALEVSLVATIASSVKKEFIGSTKDSLISNISKYLDEFQASEK